MPESPESSGDDLPPRHTGRGPRLLRAPILRALLAQGVAALLLAGMVQFLWRTGGAAPPLWATLGAMGVVAAGLGRLLRLPVWWLPVQAAAPALIYGAAQLQLPAWAYGGILAALVLLLWNSAGDRVPLYLTGRRTRAALAGLVPGAEPVRAIDLGCGFGGPLLAMASANAHPESRFLGVETAPLPFLVAKARARLARDPRVAVAWRSLWNVDLAAFDVVYAFLSPEPMPRLMDKAAKEMRTGTLFVSNEFTDPAYNAPREIAPEGLRGRRLYIWKVPFARALSEGVSGMD